MERRHGLQYTAMACATRLLAISMLYDRPTAMVAQPCSMSSPNSAVTSISKPDTQIFCSTLTQHTLLLNKPSEPNCHERCSHAEHREHNSIYLTSPPIVDRSRCNCRSRRCSSNLVQ